MNFRAHSGLELEGFQLAPLIDIVFLTLIFFIVTSALQQIERQMGITLPEAKEGEAPARQRPPYYINITRDGTVYISNLAYTYDELTTWLGDLSEVYASHPPPIIIRADEDTDFKYFVKVIDACTAAGIRNFAIANVEAPTRPR